MLKSLVREGPHTHEVGLCWANVVQIRGFAPTLCALHMGLSRKDRFTTQFIVRAAVRVHHDPNFQQIKIKDNDIST